MLSQCMSSPSLLPCARYFLIECPHFRARRPSLVASDEYKLEAQASESALVPGDHPWLRGPEPEDRAPSDMASASRTTGAYSRSQMGVAWPSSSDIIVRQPSALYIYCANAGSVRFPAVLASGKSAWRRSYAPISCPLRFSTIRTPSRSHRRAYQAAPAQSNEGTATIKDAQVRGFFEFCR